VIAFVARRLLHGAAVTFVVAFLVYGIERALRPEDYPGQAYFPHVWHDVRQALFHLDFGRACGWPGCPRIHDMWVGGLADDLWLLGGGIAIGVLAGVGAALLCVRRPRSRAARGVEWVGMLAYCTPVYVVGLGLLLAFNSQIGAWPVPYFFDAKPAAYASPIADPWAWGRSFLVPWLVVAAPLAGACLRATVAMTLDELDRDYVRTAVAKGLPKGRVIRRHAGPGAYPSVVSLVWGAIPTIVTNVVLVELVFNVPGFFENAKRAIGQDKAFPPTIDVPMLQALALWAAVLIVLVSIVSDIVLVSLDPRVRATTRTSGAIPRL
jgi:peptide/nickel transport system permease protein